MNQGSFSPKEKGPKKTDSTDFTGSCLKETCETRGITISKERNRGTTRKESSADPITAI